MKNLINANASTMRTKPLKNKLIEPFMDELLLIYEVLLISNWYTNIY